MLKAELLHKPYYLNIIKQEKDRRDAPKVECGCCYGDFPNEEMTSCDKTHIFCLGCAKRAADIKIGMQKTQIPCLSQGECDANFSQKEVKRFLAPAVYTGWCNLVMRESIEEAKNMGSIDGFEMCPFCPYGCMMEAAAEVDKLFRCQGMDCGIVSCRLCKKKNHIPMSCEGIYIELEFTSSDAQKEADSVIDAGNVVAEAMTQALLRTCPTPNCGKQFFKDDGCNKMTCPECKKLS
jgi:TRIAD3 protein (E3 ubiquitin-protein ligase RNF216)